MAASASDKLKKLSKRWVGQIGAAGVSDGVTTTIPLASVTNLATDTAVVITIDRVDVNGVATPSLEESLIGVVSGSNLINCIRGVEGTAQGHNAGAVVEILVTAKGYNDMVDWGLVEHNQDGTHASTIVKTTTSQTLTTKTIDGDNNTLSHLPAANLKIASQAAGDILYASSSTVWARLAKGSNGQILTLASGIPSWAAGSNGSTAYAVTPTSGQTTTNGTFEDMAAGTQSVVLSVTSNVYVEGHADAFNSGSNDTAIQITYDSGGGDTVVGTPGTNVGTNRVNISCGGIVVNLAAGTYTFAMMKRITGGTGTFNNPFMSILVTPAA